MLVEQPDSGARLAPAAAQLRGLVFEGKLSHDGDPDLARHMGDVVVREIQAGPMPQQPTDPRQRIEGRPGRHARHAPSHDRPAPAWAPHEGTCLMPTDITTAPRIVSMATDTPGDAARGTSLWWLDRLSRRMAHRNATLKLLRAYYRGEQDTWRLASDSHRSAFGRLFDGLKANLAKPIVDAVEHRLIVDGFDIPNDQAGGRKAWRLWQDNGLEAMSSLAHTEALSVGECPVIVWMDPGAPAPRVSVEDPLQVYVERSVVNPAVALAGLKRWYDYDDRTSYAVLYLPTQVEWWVNNGGGWKPRVWGLNPIGRVPIVTLVNMPRLVEPPGRYSRGEAEHEAVLTLLRPVQQDAARHGHHQRVQRLPTAVRHWRDPGG